MTVFFIIGFIVSLVARILFGFFVNKVAVFAELLLPLTFITIGFAILAAVFIGIEIYNKITGKKK